MSRFNILFVLGGLSTFVLLNECREYMNAKTKVVGIP